LVGELVGVVVDAAVVDALGWSDGSLVGWSDGDALGTVVSAANSHNPNYKGMITWWDGGQKNQTNRKVWKVWKV
jgi:hypothetical protein